MPIKDLKLQNVKLRDRPYLLQWDTPNDSELRKLAYCDNAEVISYRTDLLRRIEPESRYLSLHHQLERELAAIKAICANTNKPVVLLKDLDYLITYLHIQTESPITLFWSNLFNTRHLESILWIILPTQLVPPNWDERLKQV